MDWTDFRLILATAGGALLALLLSTATTWKARFTCVLSGVMFAYFGTEPMIHWAGDAYLGAGWPYVIAGGLAMLGDRLARRALQLADRLTLPGGRE